MTRLEEYIEQLQAMGRASMHGLNAPHKPLLLLAVMNLIEKGVIATNRIVLSKELECEFKRLWDILVNDGDEYTTVTVCEGLDMSISRKYPFKCNISNPYYYLQNEPFWGLVKSDKWKKHSSYSVKNLREEFLYAEIDAELFEMLNNGATRETIRNSLLSMI